MTADRRATPRPFTVVCCGGCGDDSEPDVLGALGQSVRRCQHGVLIHSGCVLGPRTCAKHRHGTGVMVVLQPCSVDRSPCAPARWVGPIRDHDDARILTDWLELGQWHVEALPDRLRPIVPTATSSRRN